MVASRVTLANLTSFCRRTGFVFPSSEVYGGASGLYDYGPLGVLLKRNLRESWWRTFVTARSTQIHGMETSVLMAGKVWRATGHVDCFSDDSRACLACGQREREPVPSKCPHCGKSQ
jgi:glycyl-tRNA synthetase